MRVTKNTWVVSIGVVLFATAVMIVWVLAPLSSGVFRDVADVLGTAYGSPIALAFPLVLLVPVVGLISAPITNRFVSQLWSRRPMRRTLALWAARVVGVVVVTAGMAYGLVALFVMLVVPRMFPESIDSTGYGMTASQARADLLERFNFGVFGAGGYAMFAVLFVVFIALQAGVYALLTLGCAVRWGRPVLAVFVPIAVFMGLTVLCGFLGQPAFAPLYTVAPFGLNRTGEWQPLAGLAVIIIGTGAIWMSILSDPRRADALL